MILALMIVIHKILAIVVIQKAYVIGIIIFSFASIGIGFATNFTIEDDADILFTPFGGKFETANTHAQTVRKLSCYPLFVLILWSNRFRFLRQYLFIKARPLQHLDWIQNDSGFLQTIKHIGMTVHADGRNVLGRDGVFRLFEAMDTVRKTPGYDELCAKSMFGQVDYRSGKNTCLIQSATQYWNHTLRIYKEEITTDEETVAAMSKDQFPNGEPVDRIQVILQHSQMTIIMQCFSETQGKSSDCRFFFFVVCYDV